MKINGIEIKGIKKAVGNVQKGSYEILVYWTHNKDVWAVCQDWYDVVGKYDSRCINLHPYLKSVYDTDEYTMERVTNILAKFIL